MKMEIINLIIFMNLIIFIECFYRRSRKEATWSDARDQCEEFGGRLATPNNIARFHANIKDAGILLDNGDELWVGATLTSRAWRWQGLTDRPFIDNEHLYENKGCYHQQYWYGGTQQDSPSPRACLQLCQWQGRVGLKEDFCLCEQDILNISTTPDGYCHFKCSGSSSDMCGGVRGLSIYKPVNRSIYWTTDEPKPDNDCVLLKRDGVHSKLELVSAQCHMQTRYLCRFEYDDKCGINDVCIRASSSQTTWYKARTNCLAMNGSLAELDESDDTLMRDLQKLPPGSFWIALSRRRTWNWIDTGDAVFMVNFFGHEKEMSPERACAVVNKINGRLGLAGRPCTSRKQYFCQYDYMLKREDVSIPGANKTNQNSADDITFTFTTSRPADTDVDGHRTDDKSTADQSTEGSQSEPAMLFGSNGLLNTCIYVVLGFVAGMVCVLVLGMIVYAVCRCTRPKQTKHAPLGKRQDSRRRNHDNQSANSVSYSSKDESLHIQTASPPSDITYDSVYDQGESPFRRTQRIIRMGSANSWRHSLPRKPHSDLYEPMNADFTWRGIVGGKEEVLNTQLRETGSHTGKDETDGHFRTSLHSADVHDHVTSSELNQHSLMRRQQKINDDIRKDFDEIEGLYDLPGPVESCSSKRATVNLGFQPETPIDERKNPPTFLNLEAKIDETSNDESIYATIKKTYQKLNDDLASAESDSNSEMMYTVKLN